MALQRFSTPANLDELSEANRDKWSDEVARLIDESKTPDRPQFFNPLPDPANPVEPTERPVVWTAFPATLVHPGGSDEQRWEEADGDRDLQDEYCEWGVEKSGDEIVRVTFTTETPDYFGHMLTHQEKLFVQRYEELAGETPDLTKLHNSKGRFEPRNEFNRPDSGRIAHLSQGSNHLSAAVELVAAATILRERDGRRVTDQADLVDCGRFGEPRRNSDPQIASAVNQLAAQGEEISVADPAGLYIHELITAGMTTPDEADAADFWEVTRGDKNHALRARFEVSDGHEYSVSQVKIDGEPIRFGAQLADHVRVRVVALSRPGGHEPVPQPCEPRN
jgi:hypothetical protein